MIERIVDANLNRLSEGARVIEDVCRFGLDEARIAGELKSFRQAVGRLRRALAGDWLSGRDSMGDVGRVAVKEPDRRADLAEVLGASFGRVAESLRVLEEMAKLRDGDAAALAKALRYQAYELEKQIMPLFDRRARAARLKGLYLVMTDPAAGYEALTEAAVRGGVAAIQLREKQWESGRLLDLARRLREMTRAAATLFFINDRPDIARLCEADGLHLGQGDLGVAEARRIVGERMLVGKSTHNQKQLRATLAERPDYVGIGPLFPTASKANPDPLLGLEKARRMLERCPVPAVAIGGIQRANLTEVLRAGFQCYALIAEVGRAKNPRTVIRALKEIEKQTL